MATGFHAAGVAVSASLSFALSRSLSLSLALSLSLSRSLSLSLSLPPSCPFTNFFWGGFPYKNRLQKKGILTSLLEDLDPAAFNGTDHC